MNVILYLPAREEFQAVREAVAGAFPGMKVVDASETAAQSVADAAFEAGKAGVLVVHPPLSADSARALDEALRARLGKAGMPRAVFFAPAHGKPGSDPFADYREQARPVYRHYHRDRRAVEFRKPAAKAAAAAVRAARRRAAIVRWWAAAPALVLVLAAAAAGLHSRDALVKRVVVERAQAAFGARVEVSGLSTTLTPEIRIENGTVADRRQPMRNLFEFKSLRGGIEASSLASGRLVIPELALEGLRFHTPRSESGALPAGEPKPEEPPEPPKAETGKEDFAKNLEAALDRLAETFAPPKAEDLQTVKAAKALEEESRKRYERLAAEVKALDLKGRFERNRESLEGLFKRPPPSSIEKVREDLKGLKGLTFGPKDVEGIQAALASAAGVDLAKEKKSLEALKADLESLKAGLEESAKTIQKVKAVQKISLKDVPAVTALLDDARKTYDTLSATKKKVETAAASLEAARKSLETKKASVEKALAGGTLDLGKAREGLDAGGSQALAAFETLRKDAEAAWADIDRERKAVMDLLAGLEKELLELQAAGEKLAKELEDDAKYLLSQVDVMQAALEADRKMLEERYALERLDADALLKVLLGESLAGWAEFGYRAYVALQPYVVKVAKAQPKKRSLGRGKGTSYSFPPETPEGPAVWVRTLSFQGVIPIRGRDFDLTGKLFDLSSDPALAGKPLRLEFQAVKDGRTVRGEIRYDPTGRMDVSLSLSGFPVSGIGFRGRYAPREIRARELKASLDASFEAKSVRVRAALSVEGLSVDAELPGVERHVAAALRRVYEGVPAAEAEVALRFDWPALAAVEVRTDLGARLETAFRDALAATIEDAKKEVLLWLEENTATPLAGARAAVDAYQKDGRVQVGPLAKDAASLIDRATGGKAGLSGKLAEYESLLKIPDDPSQATALARAQLDKLEKELADRGVRFSADYTDKAALLDAVAKILAERQSGSSANEKDLKAEIDRIEKMIKKVLPF
ncbi:MAG: hypothetical protein MUC63_07635 [Planctomycetes bacterium]|nr:hypothetical protein [Planctomycetota bacterium]